MVKHYLQAIDVVEIEGALMWVMDMSVPCIVDITPAAAAIVNRTPEQIIDIAIGDAHDLQQGYWQSISSAAQLAQNQRVLETRVPEHDILWHLETDGSLRKFKQTKSWISNTMLLVVAHDISEQDPRITWLQRCNFDKKFIRLPNKEQLSFCNMESLALNIRGYSGGTAAKALQISKDAYKKRLKSCANTIGVDSMEALKIWVSSSGLIHLLMINLLPPYPDDLTLAQILKVIDQPLTANLIP